MGGWIKLHRDLENHWLWKDKPFSKGQAWIDLLILVNHEEGKDYRNGRLVIIERGQKITSILKLADRWGWSRKKVSKFLDDLERDGMLEQKRTTQDTTLTLANYDVYQSQGQPREQQKNSAGTTKEQRGNTNKKERIKEQKNKRNNNIPSAEQLISDFETIYEIYPKKVGRTKAFDNYKVWLTGKVVNGKKVRLTNRDMYIAVHNYVAQRKDEEADLKFYKNFDTLMGKQLLDYVEEESNEQPGTSTTADATDDSPYGRYQRGELKVDFEGFGDM